MTPGPGPADRRHGEDDIAADDWVEQDLLTRDLAAGRLADLEAETRAALRAEWERARSDPATVELLQRRLRAIAASRDNIIPTHGLRTDSV